MYLALTDFTQRKRKTYMNDLLAVSLVSIIVYIYCTYLKITEHVMKFSYTKPFNEKMQEQLVKIWEKDFSAI